MHLVRTGLPPDFDHRAPGLALGLAFFVCLSFAGLSTASAQIGGRTEYTGTESGKIYVEAFTEEDASFEKLTTSMINPGPFSFTDVDEGTYTVIAYIDSNDSATLDPEETWVESGSPVTVPPGNTSLVLNLDEPTVEIDDGDEDNGCCAVIGARRATPAGALLLLAALVLLRRRR